MSGPVLPTGGGDPHARPGGAAQRPRVALALGAGGARGYAHIGALQVLRERGYEVTTIAGSSMGALVGGLYAAGALDEFEAWARGLGQVDVLRLLNVSLVGPGAIRAEKVFALVSELVDGVRIEELPFPYTAVATDLVNGREVWFQHGPLDAAIRASISLPGIFAPVMLNGRLLVDGGLMDPVPIAPTAAVPTDLTIAISLGGNPHDRAGASATGETTDLRPVEEWRERFRRGAARFLDGDLNMSRLATRAGGPGGGVGAGAAPGSAAVEAADAAAASDAGFEALPAGLTKVDVMQQSLEAMQAIIARYRLAGFPPDVLITIPRDAARTLDFHRAAAMIELGRERTIAALDQHVLATGGAAH
ncbi:putative NTE family protein [Paraconexibacter sp. AEG42_29]|uniref:NTE family protein n=1 Tax=Paraconexibacter sp. AEG42_29 TaxID=2997339 RepID=A0AAU7B0S7_9ACTN